MSHLVPVRRMDRSGRVQTRWVRPGAAGDVSSLDGVTPPSPHTYTEEDAAREFSSMLVERGIHKKSADAAATLIQQFGETARIEAVSALDLTHNYAGVSMVLFALKGGDEGFVRTVCESLDFCSEMYQPVFDKRQANGVTPGYSALFAHAGSVYEGMWVHSATADKAARIAARDLADVAQQFKAELLLEWTEAKRAAWLRGEIYSDAETIRDAMDMIEPAVGDIALVVEGIKDWAKDSGPDAPPTGFGAATALEIAKLSAAFPGSGERLYAFARERGSFDPATAEAFLGADTPAIADGLL